MASELSDRLRRVVDALPLEPGMRDTGSPLTEIPLG
ncbi:hypothetical protein SAMN05443544_2232 [Agromyces cerinus subsp. cerinus]|uniref:Uncharacterized protein n=1 Tax=Agromyces cerinus subsp. cerinus TaxID=232089 RepID=A0A1N6G2H2_9MICO|nr:hypothetical protein SAMN05443544_2232 [Agromyces cerinus subsp. cerinus]